MYLGIYTHTNPVIHTCNNFFKKAMDFKVRCKPLLTAQQSGSKSRQICESHTKLQASQDWEREGGRRIERGERKGQSQLKSGFKNNLGYVRLSNK